MKCDAALQEEEEGEEEDVARKRFCLFLYNVKTFTVHLFYETPPRGGGRYNRLATNLRFYVVPSDPSEKPPDESEPFRHIGGVLLGGAVPIASLSDTLRLCFVLEEMMGTQLKGGSSSRHSGGLFVRTSTHGGLITG